jgi:cytoskeletal protein CcmA (bactofilin family)
MKISGSGRLSAGKIDDELHVSGSARIEGNFECNGFQSSGSFRGSGDLTVHGDIKSSGSFRLIGSIHGDGDARSSGSSRVEGGIFVQGEFSSSGSLRAGNNVEALQGIRFTGSSIVKGDLLSKHTIDITGSTTIYGDITGNNVFIGRGRVLKGRSVFKHPDKVHGSVSAKNNVVLIRTLVEEDVKGRVVKIGRGTEVIGTVYYVDEIEIDEKSILTNSPIQITSDDLKLPRKINKKNLY